MPEPHPNPRPGDDDSPIRGRNGFTARLEQWIATATPSCTRVVRLISDSLDQPSGLPTRLTLRAHYLVCCYCRRYEQQMHRLRRFTIALPEHLDEAMPDRLDEAVKERIKERLRSSR
jgi:hypothetical protein